MRILHVECAPRGAVSRVQADDPPLKGQVPIYALYMGPYIGVGAYGWKISRNWSSTMPHSIYLGELSKMRILHVQWPPRGAVSRVQADDPPLKGQIPI